MPNNQALDIDRTIRALQALKAKTQPDQVRTLAHQLDSYDQHKDVAKEGGQIAIDFLTEICASAASLGNDENSAEIREMFREHITDALDDVFGTADAWADEVREEIGEAA